VAGDLGFETPIPVAIVGGGPVGMVLAMQLARFGVRSIVFNTEAESRWHPKGSTHGSRTMELYRRLGLAEAIRALGLPEDHPTDVLYSTRYGGDELARIRMDSEREKRVARGLPTDLGPEPIFRSNQMYVERFLCEHLRTLAPAVEMRFGWSAINFNDHGDGVTVTAEHGATGRRSTWRAQYLIGCDGGSGLVRRTLGIRYEGSASLDQPFFGGDMVSTYVRIPEFYRSVITGRRAWQYWVVNPELRSAIVALNGDDEFLALSRLPEGRSEPDDASVIKNIQRASNRKIDVKVLGHGRWKGGVALVAERYGLGRVLIAGDSTHLFTPTGGFGMNTGLEDSANLAWKLAGAVQGWADPRVIETFDSERRPIGKRNTSASRALAKSVGEVDAPAHLEENSNRGFAARRVLGDVLGGFGEEFASIGVQLGARYDDSPIIVGDGTSAPPDSYVSYTPSAVPGGRAPHVWLAHGLSIFDRFGPGFTLLRFGGHRAPSVARLEHVARSRGVPFLTLDLESPAARAVYERDLVLIRPDHHIAWRGNQLPADADTLLARVTGRAL
jgi:2-polyprenyl-6-methoxyphenol hydroxylase-like FAD-dependent oxidoreductase